MRINKPPRVGAYYHVPYVLYENGQWHTYAKELALIRFERYREGWREAWVKHRNSPSY